MLLTIQPLQATDWPALTRIYQKGIDTGQAPAPEDMARKYLPAPQLVAQRADEPIGYALPTAVSGRHVYGGVAEGSLYVREWPTIVRNIPSGRF